MVLSSKHQWKVEEYLEKETKFYRWLHPKNTWYPKTHNDRKCDVSQVAYRILSINRHFRTL